MHHILPRRSMVRLPLLLTVLLILCMSEASSAEDMASAQATGKRNEYAVLKYLSPVLTNSGKAARVYYAPSSCVTDENYPNPFPKIDVQPPSKGVSGLAAVREIFARENKIDVAEEPIGIIRIRIGKVAEDILQTRIRSITFTQHEQYNPELAILAVIEAKEVQSAMHDLGIHAAARDIDVQIVGSNPKLPHIPESMTNTTMEEALDQVAHTFEGIVEYSPCPELHVYTVDFVGGPGFNETIKLQQSGIINYDGWQMTFGKAQSK